MLPEWHSTVTHSQAKPCACVARFDRLPWAVQIRGSAWGAPLAIRLADASILSLVERVLPSGWGAAGGTDVARSYSIVRAQVASSDGALGWALFRGHVAIARSSAVDDVLNALEIDLQTAVAEHCRGWTFLHAAMVGVGSRAIVLPGASGAGKSTLTAALLREGARYGSDEYAVLDDTGRVYPFPRRLAPGFEFVTLGVPLPIGLVVAAHYEPSADPGFRPLSAGAAALELIRHCPSAAHAGAQALARSSAAARVAPAYRWARPEADVAAVELLRFAESHWRVDG